MVISIDFHSYVNVYQIQHDTTIVNPTTIRKTTEPIPRLSLRHASVGRVGAMHDVLWCSHGQGHRLPWRLKVICNEK